MTSAKTPEVLEGGCHCGSVRFRVVVRGRNGVRCNCSICHRKGFLHLIVDEDDFELLQGADALSTYTFGTHTARHHFCTRCGIHSFYRPRSHPERVDINIRCLESVTPSDFSFYDFDGQRWEESVDALRASQRSDQ